MKTEEKRVLDFLQALYRFQPVSELSELICHRLPELIGGENAILCGHDGKHRIITSVTARHAFSRANMMPHINESGIMATHPLWEGVLDEQQPVRAVSDLISRRDWHRNTLYQEVFRPDGIEDQLNTEIRGDHQAFLTVNVLRGRRGFTPEERELFLVLRPHLAQAFHNALIAARAGLFPGNTERRWILPVDHHGRVLPEGESAVMELERWFGVPGGLPAVVAGWIVEQVRRLNEGWRETRLEPLSLIHHGRHWQFTLGRQYEHGHYSLVIERLDDAGKPTALSPREGAIMEWVAAGKTNEEIGLILGISVNTVKTHLKRCFHKLGVENRTAAVATWQEMSGKTR